MYAKYVWLYLDKVIYWWLTGWVHPWGNVKSKTWLFLNNFSLLKGGTAVDAVEGAVRILEDDPTFDAGHGSVLTEDLTVEVDAMIMDGYSLESGTSALVLLAKLGVSQSSTFELETEIWTAISHYQVC